MIITSKFTHTCPSCTAKDKLIKKCSVCGVYCCSECSIDVICMDCYIIGNRQEEKNIYFKDKYKVGVTDEI